MLKLLSCYWVVMCWCVVWVLCLCCLSDYVKSVAYIYNALVINTLIYIYIYIYISFRFVFQLSSVFMLCVSHCFWNGVCWFWIFMILKWVVWLLHVIVWNCIALTYRIPTWQLRKLYVCIHIYIYIYTCVRVCNIICCCRGFQCNR